MPPVKTIEDSKMVEVLGTLRLASPRAIIRAWQIKDALAKEGLYADESTIRGRFIAMGTPLGGTIVSSGCVSKWCPKRPSRDPRSSCDCSTSDERGYP
jgi:hypothetical protein